MMSSAMLVAWSAMRSKWRVARMNWRPGLTSGGSSVMCRRSCSKIIAFEVRGHLGVAENERAETLADHGAHGGGHGGQFFGNLCTLHFAEGDDALGEIHRQVADALEVIGYFQSGNDQPHLIVGKRPSPEQADGVFIDDHLHFVDAGFKEKHFPGESRGAQIFQANDGIERAVHGAFDGARHGDAIVHQRVVEHGFGKPRSCCHWSPFSERRTGVSLVSKSLPAISYSSFTRM